MPCIGTLFVVQEHYQPLDAHRARSSDDKAGEAQSGVQIRVASKGAITITCWWPCDSRDQGGHVSERECVWVNFALFASR